MPNILKSLHLLIASAALVSAAQAQEPALRDAVECRERGGLPHVFAKWKGGSEVRVAFLGGSITAQNGWRPKTMAWFRKEHPRSSMVEINAAIGGTGSDLGVFRLRQDVLDHKPDLLFVEFAVNDSGAPSSRILKAMEGIVRQTKRANPNTDICFVYTLSEGMLGDLERGKFPPAASVMEEVADHYQIPSIHMGIEVAKRHMAGNLIFKGPRPSTGRDGGVSDGPIVFSGDGVHPYVETGHQLYVEAIQRSFARLEKGSGGLASRALPPALNKDNWENAKLIPLSAVTLSPGWKKLDPATDPVAQQFRDRLPGLWLADKPGESIRFQFRGTMLSIYDLLGPDCGQVSVQVDHGTPEVIPRFDAYCTYRRLATLGVIEGAPDSVHTVTIRLLAESPDKLAILHRRVENQGITELDPKLYGRNAWYAGAILVLGDLVPADSPVHPSHP